MIYILNFQYEPNSASGNRLMGYYKALDEMGLDIKVVFLYPNQKHDKIKVKFKSIQVEYYWKKWFPYRGLFRRLTLKRYVCKFLSQLKPGDIVYTYNISKLTMLCKKIKGVKVFAERTEHPIASPGFPHPLLALSDKELLQTIKSLDGLFVISTELKAYYCSQGLSHEKIHIINMFVDSSRFDCLSKSQHSERYVAYCGTASNNKDGVDELIKAFSFVSKHCKDIKLYIIGKTPSKKQHFDNLELVRKLGIEDSVVFKGIIPSERIPQILMDAEILALDRPNNLQSKYGFPTKLGEYLMTKNPVVVTDVGDIHLFLKDGESILMTDVSNSQAFAEKIIWVLQNPAKAKKISLCGYKVAMNNFNSIIETKKMYNCLISR